MKSFITLVYLKFDNFAELIGTEGKWINKLCKEHPEAQISIGVGSDQADETESFETDHIQRKSYSFKEDHYIINKKIPDKKGNRRRRGIFIRSWT
eukprot:UN05776